jgi:hypothetical protein
VRFNEINIIFKAQVFVTYSLWDIDGQSL